MSTILKLGLILFIYIFCACEDHDKTPPDFFILNTELPAGQLPKGFSIKQMKIVSFPNPENVYPDFILSVHTNDVGDIIGPMLSHPDLNNRFIFRKSFGDLNSAQTYFDTLTVFSQNLLQPFALDIKPFEIWQVKSDTQESGIILVLETRTEKINNTPFAEIKFKARNIIP